MRNLTKRWEDCGVSDSKLQRSRSKGPPSGVPEQAESSATGPKRAKDAEAVALSYQPDSPDSAPRVIAHGRGFKAEEILRRAFESGTPVREDPDLVSLLVAAEIGEEIPVEAFIAVAEILRYVYALNGTTPPVAPEDEVETTGYHGA